MFGGGMRIDGACLGERMGGSRGDGRRDKRGRLRGIWRRMGGEIVRDMEADGASHFWETVPKAGRFFCAIVGL